MDTKNLHPIVKDLMNKFVETCKQKGINVIITQGFRSKAEQDALYAQGRTKPGSVVTNAKGGQSNHNYGLAFDFALLQNGKVTWDSRDKRWAIAGMIGESLGLEWGGRWKQFIDLPHLEFMFGLTINDLIKGKRPPNVIKIKGPSELKGLTEKQLVRTKIGIYKII